MTQNLDKIIFVVASVLGVAKEELGPDSGMESTANWDSLKHVQIIMAIEQAFGKKFQMEQLMEFTTIGKIAQALEEIN